MILFAYGTHEPELVLHIAYKEPKDFCYTVKYFSSWWGDWVVCYLLDRRFSNKRELLKRIRSFNNIEIFHQD